ncbi:dihydrolipoamide acetyltransferase family protein [Actinoallomurus rhizosphaericola]|uniref:dihydrolipoamide acetyltransferase family protein n=1 Tax=Actinoallomurus rhizosphaericola TaxID=2952536 RepID=UPI002093C3E8|nr:dihydrolipoamide acetyltransferase family protein [Actinoallomurus rhizosphaericola]MCO5999500.1 2-oxo acid dehydrogenase subunit E2 [Actinoallomurus rhizosphaericola]
MIATGTEVIFRLPDLGEGLTEAEITEWRVSPGDTVTVDQNVVEVETAKAAVDVPIPIEGTVARLYGEVGSVIAVGEPLIAVTVAAGPDDTAGENSPTADERRREARDERYREEERAGSGNVLVGYGTSAARRSRRRRAGRTISLPQRRDPAPPQVAAAPRAASATSAARTTVRPEAPRVISPVVRQLARAHAIDLAALTPSGPGGVVLRRDVDAAIAAATRPGRATTATAQAPEAAVPAPAAAPGLTVAPEPVESADDQAPVRVPIRGVRRTIAEKLSRSRREIPDASTWVDVDATPLVELKEGLARTLPDARIGMLALFARICVAGLRRFPELNAYVDTEREEIVQVPQVHLGFAAQTDRGLLVPVVRDAHRLTLAELGARIRERTEAARAGRLDPRDLTGGTFTLNNYGVFGVDGSNPIINHPEAAMLGVGRIADRPWAFEGEIRLRKVAQLSFTFDHRVCDGGVAGGFLRFVADCVERPELLIAHL